MQTYLEKRQPAKNVARFYRMAWFAAENQAVAALVTLEASKRQRGYWVEPQQLAMFR